MQRDSSSVSLLTVFAPAILCCATPVGTMLYVAPEVTRGTRYDEKCDVYSFAMVLVALIEQTPDLFELFAAAYRHSELFEPEEEEVLSSDTSGVRASRSAMRRITVHMLTNAIIHHQLRPQLRTTVVESLRLLTVNCWDEDAARRPSFNEISTFLADVVKDEVGERKVKQKVGDGTGLRRIQKMSGIPIEMADLHSTSVPVAGATLADNDATAAVSASAASESDAHDCNV